MPRLLVQGVTVAEWQAAFDWVGGGRRPWRYAEGDVERPLPTAAAVFARPADAPPAALQIPLYTPTSVLTLRPASTTELRFDLDLRALSDGSHRLRTLLDLTEELW